MLKDSPVKLYQDKNELERLGNFVRLLNPTKIVEISFSAGDTLWYWMQICNVNSTFVSIDRKVDEQNEFYELQKRGHNRLWYEWANERNHYLQIIERYSQDPKVVETLYTVYKPVDFIFINGNRPFIHVLQDYQNYFDLVQPEKGIIAFSDVAVEGSGGNQVWNKIWNNSSAVKMVSQPGQHGIGVIFFNGEVRNYDTNY